MIKGRIQSVLASCLAVLTVSALVGLDVLRGDGDVLAVPTSQQNVVQDEPAPERLPLPANPQLLDVGEAGLEKSPSLPYAGFEGIGARWSPEYGDLPYAADEIPGEFTDQFNVADGTKTEAVDYFAVDSGNLLAMPVQGRFTSRFGMRYHPILKIRKLHSGADWAAPCGTPIGAAETGRVIRAGWANGYGNHIRIDHGTIAGIRVVTTYSHLSSFGVTVGQEVERGQGIGRVGTTGYSTGCHLHFEVIANGQFQDPLRWLNADPADIDITEMLEGAGSPTPSEEPSVDASEEPSEEPTETPTGTPTQAPSQPESPAPTPSPSVEPSAKPSTQPPSGTPSAKPSTPPTTPPPTTPPPTTQPPITQLPSSPPAEQTPTGSTSGAPSSPSPSDVEPSNPTRTGTPATDEPTTQATTPAATTQAATTQAATTQAATEDIE